MGFPSEHLESLEMGFESLEMGSISIGSIICMGFRVACDFAKLSLSAYGALQTSFSCDIHMQFTLDIHML